MLKLSLFFILFSQFSYSQNQGSRFLSYDEFQNLTYAQQQHYIVGLRNFVTDLSKNPVFVSENSYSIPSKYWAWVEMAQASSLEQVCTVKSAKNYSDMDLLEKVQGMNGCRESRNTSQKAASTPYLAPVGESLFVLSEEMSERIQTGRLSLKNYKVRDTRGMLLGHIRDARSFGVGSTELDSRLKASAERLQGASGGSAKPSVENESKSVKSMEAKVTTETPQAKAQETNVVTAGQCLYAGFVIPKSKPGCQPYRQLPERFSDIFDLENFICDSNKEILCNPLLFGYIEKCTSDEKKPCKLKKPVCVERSRFATRNCQSKAESFESLDQVTKLVTGETGEKIYSDFISSLESLCDPAVLEKRNLKSFTKKDIEQTCEVAFKSLDEHLTKQRLPLKLKPKSEKNQTVQ